MYNGVHDLAALRYEQALLQALDRGVPVDAPRVLEHIDYLRNAVAWLDQHGDRLVELATRTLTDEGDA
jgi:hypothetical protein